MTKAKNTLTKKMQADVIVIGAGHAGCEAASAVSRLNKTCILVSLHKKQIGRLSCNPAIGGLAKGNLVREIDALGGVMAKVADRSSIQFRRLNTRKGLAVQSSRAQVDIDLYPLEMSKIILGDPNITFVEGEAVRIITDDFVPNIGDQHYKKQLKGLQLADGTEIESDNLIVTTGTFLQGLMHCGSEQTKGGRIGETAAYELATSLLDLGFTLGRLKTGTCPRLDSTTIDWSKTEPQVDLDPLGRFSFSEKENMIEQRNCYMAYTNETTHEIIEANLDTSPMFSGQIVGVGPRYCPSIEDKIVRFQERKRHLLFLEPEGLYTNRVYINGLSTSLPKEVQEKMVHSISGLEHAKIIQYGYAVEYDFIDPRDLEHSLQHKTTKGLFLAGQINGTSGYEEAAAQGLVAGLSAASGVPFVLQRDQAYIGVLIDDLVTRGVGGEPYRMFSSRAEHRLSLREDNADRRLTPIGIEWGIISKQAEQRFQNKLHLIKIVLNWCETTSVTPTTEILELFQQLDLAIPKSRLSMTQLLRRPKIDWNHIFQLYQKQVQSDNKSCIPHEFEMYTSSILEEVLEQVSTDIKYAGYLERDKKKAIQREKLDAIRFPIHFNFYIDSISTEVAERLQQAQPKTLGAASRLPGITPAAIDALAVYIAKARIVESRN